MKTMRKGRALEIVSMNYVGVGSLLTGGAFGTAFAALVQASTDPPSPLSRLLISIAPAVGAAVSALVQHASRRLEEWRHRREWAHEREQAINESGDIVRRGKEMLPGLSKPASKKMRTRIARHEMRRVLSLGAAYPERPWIKPHPRKGESKPATIPARKSRPRLVDGGDRPA